MQKAGLSRMSNHPAAGKAGIGSRLTIGHHCPGLPEPGRWAFIESTMKTILTFVLLGLLMTACSRRDAAIQKELTGTWTRHLENGVSVTNLVAPDGTYRCQLGGPTGPTHTLEGTLIAQNGMLIDTLTKDGQTNLPMARVMQWQIVRIDRHELILSGNNGATMTAVRSDN